LLTGKQKRFLRGRGHALKPVVQIGKQGLAAPLLREIEECLQAHELIKVRVLESAPLERRACAEAICAATGADLAQSVGRMLLLYRAHPEKPVLELPPAS
jgi:RNA-binding protein